MSEEVVENKPVAPEVVEKDLKSELNQSDLAALQDFGKSIEPPPESVAPVPTVVPPAEPEPIKEPATAGEAPPPRPEDTIQARPYAKGEFKRDIDALKTIIGTERLEKETSQKELAELKAQKEKLEQEYKGKVITPEWEAEFRDLKELRREVQLQNDPEFKRDWEAKLSPVDASAMTILKASNLPPDVEEEIKNNGGIVAMSISPKMMNLSRFSTISQADFVEEQILPNLGSSMQRRRLEQLIMQGITLREDMSREIEEIKTKGSDRQKKRQQEIQDKFNSAVSTTREQLGEMAKKIDYPKDVTPSQKAKVDKHNALVDKAEKAYQDYITNGATNPELLGQAFARAAASFSLTDKLLDKEAEIAEKDAKIKELEDKWEKMKRSSSTGRETSAPTIKKSNLEGTLLTDQQALAEAFPGKI